MYNKAKKQTLGVNDMTYHLAIDIGASSGRHILGYTENGKLITEEIYRFDNGMIKTEQGLVWDMETLYSHVLKGIRLCHLQNKTPQSIAIDTWGVDYVLLDAEKMPLLPVYAYRNEQRQAVISEVESILPHTSLYQKTGIQFQPFNTVYQLYCDKKSGKLARAAHFMQIPDYLAYRLTDKIQNEYTNATTTSLVNANSQTWDQELLHQLGFPASLFDTLTPPSSLIGNFSKQTEETLGFSAKVLACPTHDTASAFSTALGGDDCLILYSGTWSLIGAVLNEPITSEEAKKANFTNEGGINGTTRFLKNIMGMWLFQNIRRETDKRYTYNEMMTLAMKSNFTETFDVNHPSLTAPDSMTQAITSLLGYDFLPLGDLLSSVYHSLALSYKKAVEEITAITRQKYNVLQIVGGGSVDSYLNHLTQEYTKLSVITGPKEATAIGNLLSQIGFYNHLSQEDAKHILQKSFSD